MEITEALETIINARYGRDVRQAIHDGIKQAYDDAISNGHASMEVSQARGSYTSLAERLIAELDIINKKITKGQVTMADLTQEVKEALTGGSVAVVGREAVGSENVKPRAITGELTDFMQIGKNKFNKLNPANRPHSYYNRLGEYITTTEPASDTYNRFCSHPIRVNDNDLITFTRLPDALWETTADFRGGAFDANMEWIGEITVSLDNLTIATDHIKGRIKSDLGIRYVILNMMMTDVDTYMVTLNEEYGTYQPYTLTLSDNVKTRNLLNISNEIMPSNYYSNNHNISNNTLIGSTAEIVDDFDGFKSPTGKLLKVTHPKATTQNLKYAFTKLNGALTASEIIMEYYVEENAGISEATFQLSNATTEILKVDFEIGKHTIIYHPKKLNASDNISFGIYTRNSEQSTNDIVYYIRYISVKDGKSGEVVNRTLTENDIKTIAGSEIQVEEGTTWEFTNKQDLLQLHEKGIAIGDSMTRGAYYVGNNTGNSIVQSYPYYLNKLNGWDVTNAGVSGITAKGWYDSELTKYNYAEYDFAIIWLGTNGRLEGDVSTATTDDNLGAYMAIIDTIKAQNPEIKIYLVNVGGGTEETNNNIKQIAEMKGNLPIFDHTHLRADADSNASAIYHKDNALHWTKIGNLRLAEFLSNKITSYIANHLADYETFIRKN